MGLFTGTKNDYYNGADGVPNSGDESYGNYQFISLSDIIDNFTATYVGSGKILNGVNRADISFHAHRALAELTFDTFKSCKTQEIEVPPSLTMPIPHDYVNYVKLSWSDASGIEHVIYPAQKTSNPFPIKQDDSGNYAITAVGTQGYLNDSELTLDTYYPEIRIGMYAMSPNWEGYIVVNYVANWNAGTYVELDHPTLGVNWPYTSGVQFPWTSNIYFISPELMQEGESAILYNMSWDVGDNILTQSPIQGNPKVGWRVSSQGIDQLETAIITDIQDDTATDTRTITINKAADGSAPAFEPEIYCSSDEKLADTWNKYSSATPSENVNQDYKNNDNRFSLNKGQRYGLDPQHAQTNASYFIDCDTGKIHFSSNLAGRTIILKYISDSLGTDGEMQVHKLAEEAIYKWIVYGCLIARMGIPEYVLNIFKKEKIAETRKAKLRLSSIKIEEITQIFRGRSKWIKH